MADTIRIVKTEFESNEGYTYQVPDREILDDLVKAYNELATFVAKKNGMVKETWGEDFVEADTPSPATGETA